jgi:Zn-dependent protease with chaperone function
MYGILLFYKKYKNLVIFLYFQILLYPPILFAEEDYSYIYQIANRMNDKRGNPPYSLKLKKSGPMANTRVFEPGLSRNDSPMRVCHIHINTEYIKNFQLSENAVAVVIGHEMGHCENEPLSQAYSHLSYAEKNWAKEYAADIYGIRLANEIGLSGIRGFRELASIIGVNHSATHPNMDLRIRAIETGERFISTSLKMSSLPTE